MRRVIASLAFLLASPFAQAGFIFIDDFVTPMSVQTASTTAAVTASGSVNTLTAIGVERELSVSKSATTGARQVTASTNGSDLDRFAFSAPASTSATALLTWDGAGTGAGAAGLGGLDFGNPGGGFFEVGVEFADLAAQLALTVFDATDSAKQARGVLNFVALDGTQILTLAFGDMQLLGGANSSIFSNVGAITMLVNSGVPTVQALDVEISQVRVFIPVPGTVPLALLGLGLVAAARRRRLLAA